MNHNLHTSAFLQNFLCRKAQGQQGSESACDAVVLLVDLVESTSLSERFTVRGPIGTEQLHEVLNRYFGQVFETVMAYGGDVVQVDGDATLVMWPVIDGDAREPALRACAAALALKQQFEQAWPVNGSTRFQHRFLVSRGAVEAHDCVLTPWRAFLVLAGSAVQEACAGMSVVPADGVAVTGAVHELVDGECSLDVLAPGLWRVNTSPEAVAYALSRPEQLPGTLAAHPLTCSQLRPYLPPVVAERLGVTHRADVSEFRTLTMVYAKVAMARSGQAPEGEALNQALRLVQAAMEGVGAFISNVVLGDKGLVIVIGCGLPRQAREGDAARGLEASLCLAEVLRGEGFSSSVGIATGTAFCGEVGSARRRVYLTNGAVMYTAARLMQLAEGAIWVDEETHRVAGRRFDLRAMSAVQAKGLSRQLQPHRLVGHASLVMRSPAPQPALHGRDAELAHLNAIMDVRPERCPLIAIEAVAGAGKSHLLRAAQAQALQRQWSCVSLGASPFEVAHPYAVCRRLIMALLSATHGPDTRVDFPLSDALSQVLRHTPFHEKMALLADILPLPHQAPGLTEHITGEARLTGIEDILVHLAEQAATPRPLLICVDDLHWVDDTSARLLLAVARRARHVLLVLATRPVDASCDGHVQMLHAEAQVLIELPRLSESSIHALLCDTLGVSSVPPALRSLVQERACGLPFHAQQLALSLRAQGLIKVQGPNCDASTEGLHPPTLPHALKDLIVARVDQLEGGLQDVAKIASVVHGAFAPELILAIAPWTDLTHDLPQALSRLIDAGILTRHGTHPQACEFSHGLLREVIYEMLPFQQRERLHRGLALHLEQQTTDAADSPSAELAEHWERGGRLHLAMRYRLLAARQAGVGLAHRDALHHIQSFRRMATQSGAMVSRHEQAEMARMQADACHQLSRFQEANAWYRQCAHLEGITIPNGLLHLGLSLVYQGVEQLAYRMGWLKPAGQPDKRARHALVAHMFTRMAEHAYFNGDGLGLVHATLTALNRAERAQAMRESVEGLGGMAIGMAISGQIRLAERYRLEAVSLAQRQGSLHDQGFANLLAGVSAFQSGQWVQSSAHCTSGSVLFERLGDRFRHQTCVALEGYIALLIGQHDRARQAFAHFGAHADDIDNAPVRAWFLAGWALLDLRCGHDPQKAIERLELTRGLPLQGAEQVLCDGVRALALMRAGRHHEALATASAALSMLQEGVSKMGIAVLSISAVAEVHIALGGQASQACRALQAFADHAPIGLPLAWQARAHHAMAQGHDRRAAQRWKKALRHATALQMPLEQARAHLALAHLSARTQERLHHQGLASALVTQLGPAASHGWPAWMRCQTDPQEMSMASLST